MTEMVERIARSIAHVQMKRRYEGRLENIGQVTEIVWTEFLPEAAAVLESMRQPTRSMIGAGDGEDGAHMVWIAMIDRALGKTSE